LLPQRRIRFIQPGASKDPLEMPSFKAEAEAVRRADLARLMPKVWSIRRSFLIASCRARPACSRPSARHLRIGSAAHHPLAVPSAASLRFPRGLRQQAVDGAAWSKGRGIGHPPECPAECRTRASFDTSGPGGHNDHSPQVVLCFTKCPSASEPRTSRLREVYERSFSRWVPMLRLSNG
jgi:hypothetical protein